MLACMTQHHPHRTVADLRRKLVRRRTRHGSTFLGVGASGKPGAVHSRGGLTTKIHAVVDANGNPIALKLSEGQAHDGRSAAALLDTVGEGQILLADRGYDTEALRATINPMPHRVNIPAFSPWLYRYRNLIERFFNKLKHFRAIATRFDKHDANYLALVKLAASRIWMRFMSR